MIDRLHPVLRQSASRWWASAMVLFWGATLLAAFVDFAGEKWLGVSWSRGPDLFPNGSVGYVLAPLQLGAALALVGAGVRYAMDRRSPGGIILGAALAIVTGAVCFAIFAFLALWYQTVIMGRSL